MLDLKTNLEEIEKVMKNVQNVTSCSKAEECYPRMKKLVHDNNKIKKNLISRVDENKTARIENKSSLVHREALEHNLTEDEIKLNFEIFKIKSEIAKQKDQQRECEKNMKIRGETVCFLRSAFQHIIDVVRHVGEEHTPAKQPYPNSDLELPLLKFDAILPKLPSPLEEDPETLLSIVRDRVELLMSKFKDEISNEDLLYGKQVYQKAVIKKEKLVEGVGKGKEPSETQAVMIETDKVDPNVPTRSGIKEISARIVEINLKKAFEE